MARLRFEEYFRNMHENYEELPNKPIKEDYCNYLTPATHLLELRREHAELEKALVTQKEEFGMKMDWLKRRREELEYRQLQLRQSLEKFEEFVSDHDMKRGRALKKADDERKLANHKSREISRLNEEIDVLLARRADLQKRLLAHRKYNDFMNSIVRVSSDDFREARDVIARYSTLDAIYEDLLKTQTRHQELLDDEKFKLSKFVEEKEDEMMKCNMKLAEQQKRLDEAKSRTFTSDYQYSETNNSMRLKMLEAGKILMAVNNLYYQLTSFGIRDKEYDAIHSPLQQLDKIHHFMEDMTVVLAESKAATHPTTKSLTAPSAVTGTTQSESQSSRH